MLRNNADTVDAVVIASQDEDSYFNAGNVGIGTVSPQDTLEINSSTDTRLLIRGTTESGDAGAVQFLTGSGAPAVTNVVGYIRGVITQGDPSALIGAIVFETNAGDTVAERMRITGTGNVGIGTTSPSEKLEVSGNIRLASNLTSTNFNINETSTAIVLSATSTKRLVFTTDASLWVG